MRRAPEWRARAIEDGTLRLQYAYRFAWQLPIEVDRMKFYRAILEGQKAMQKTVRVLSFIAGI
jgi:hypothetical protein